MTVTATDHFRLNRLPFLGMTRSRSISTSNSSNHQRLEDSRHFCAATALCDDEDDDSSTDDSSTSSTMSIGGCNNSSSSSAISPPDAAPASEAVAEATRRTSTSPTTVLSPETPVVKMVRFKSEEYNHIYENMEMFKDECRELWYTPNDYKHFKKSVIHLAREITLAEQRNKAPCSYQRVMMRTYQACCKCNGDSEIETDATETSDIGDGVLSDIEQRHLIRWMDVATTRLGVEKLSLRHMARDRILRRNEMMEVVFDIQDMFLTTSTTTTITSSATDDIDGDDNLDFDFDVDLDAKAEFIRNSCLTISRPLRLFAMHFAQALAASIHH